MGQRTRLSQLDIKKINIMYGCENKLKIKPDSKLESKPCSCIPKRNDNDLHEGFYFLE